jgi:hypothetical protein
MSRPVKVGLQIFAGLGLSAALLGVKGYDALHRYEMREPPIPVTHAASGQEVTLENARWQLTSLAPMPNPPKETQPDRVWLEADVKITGLNKDGIKYSYSKPGFQLADGHDLVWRAEVLRGPDEMKAGVPATFKVIGVVPKTRANRVELVVWPAGMWDSGSAVQFDR